MQLWAAFALGQDRSVQPRPETNQGAKTQYEIVAQGLLSNPTLAIEFKAAPVRLEIRDLIVGPGVARAVPVPGRTLMELRGGGVITSINGDKRDRRPGDFWTVERDSSLSLENKGDVAVIRAIRIIEEQK
jgi:hypothetical protein